ncbi:MULTISPECIES: hypothetical protein [Streptomyces]|uniref:hypothetical protein n=1 Tax=Streptomyces TaxID=1883 RepID=UPI002E27D29F|nr:hypothetical protein [Streptomyces sp. NBC_00273]
MIAHNGRPLVSSREAAKILGVAPGTFRNMKSDGKLDRLTAVPLGGARYYYECEVLTLAEERAG